MYRHPAKYDYLAWVVLLGVLFGTLLLAGCSDSGDTSTSTTTTSRVSSTTSTPSTTALSSTTTTASTTTTSVPALVTVPSYEDFPSSYTGDDWGTILESTKAAIADGFDAAGLIAEVEFVNGFEVAEAGQEPAAGSMVPEGTSVHIVIPVYD